MKCTTIDDYFPSGTSIDVIKMDVQGAEAAAFHGMERTLKENTDIKVIWELSPKQLIDAGTSARELLTWLGSLGFAFTIVDDAAGEVKVASIDDILETCPKDSFLNILCGRDG